MFSSFSKVQTESIHKVEQSMQVELSVQDKSLQTSPREEDLEKQNSPAMRIVPQVADNLVSDIVRDMPIYIRTEPQETATEATKTVEENTQTSPRNEASEVETTVEPYEIHIQASFVVPEVAKLSNISEDKDAPVVLEIQKSFVVDETQPGSVREIESITREKVKASKSKKRKETKQLPVQKDDTEEPERAVIKQDWTHPTYATLQITKTTVSKTSNVIGKERRLRDPLVMTDETALEGIIDVPLSPGNN